MHTHTGDSVIDAAVVFFILPKSLSGNCAAAVLVSALTDNAANIFIFLLPIKGATS